MTILPALAQREWAERLAFGRAAVSRGTWKPIEAEARLMPWLAVALLAGAEPAEARAELEQLRQDPATRRTARATLADRLCAGADMRAELIRARDAAVARALAAYADRPGSSSESVARQKLCERSTRLQYLAIFLGAPNRPHAAARLQEAA